MGASSKGELEKVLDRLQAYVQERFEKRARQANIIFLGYYDRERSIVDDVLVAARSNKAYSSRNIVFVVRDLRWARYFAKSRADWDDIFLVDSSEETSN